ncbi:hypothetical protein B0H14DRAFT_3459167 [Mycena olivaceomarginata]|nr:hypothetical protein B0H14DRAFT_3459167 [Mycena olivaceomarginata]
MSSSTTAFAMAAPRAGTASNLVVSTADGQTVIDTAPTRTATGGLSTYTGLSFQAPEVRGEVVPNFARGATHLQVLPGQVNTLFTSSTLTFATTRSVIETDNGQPTTFPLTISADISLVPVVTTTSQSLLSPKHRNLPSLLQYSWCCVFRRRRITKAPEILVGQRPESPKETRNPFDDSNASRESWAPYIDRRETQESRSSYNTVSTRQLYISNQVNRAREKVAELERISTLLRSSTLSSRDSGSRPGSGITATAVGDESTNVDDAQLRGVQEKLELAMLQIEGLNNRIQELEVHQKALSAKLLHGAQ